MNARARTLCAALDAHVSLLSAIVDASQRQQAELLGHRPGSDEALIAVNAELHGLSAELISLQPSVRTAANAVAREFELAPDTSLTVLADGLPLEVSQSVAERVSCIRSLTDALVELQRINNVHARRGLQLVAAWATLIARGGDNSVAPTYTRRGKQRVKAPPEPTSLVMNL